MNAVSVTTPDLRTSDGVHLEAELAVPDEAWAVAVLTHPHPRYGGDMHALVTGVLFEALPAAGVAALRFNFRGTGRSGGTHGGGGPERADVVAAVEAVAGMRMPLLERRSPSAWGICTRMRSASIWIGVLSPLEGTTRRYRL